jgi:hypothetical protein
VHHPGVVVAERAPVLDALPSHGVDQGFKGGGEGLAAAGRALAQRGLKRDGRGRADVPDERGEIGAVVRKSGHVAGEHVLGGLLGLFAPGAAAAADGVADGLLLRGKETDQLVVPLASGEAACGPARARRGGGLALLLLDLVLEGAPAAPVLLGDTDVLGLLLPGLLAFQHGADEGLGASAGGLASLGGAEVRLILAEDAPYGAVRDHREAMEKAVDPARGVRNEGAKILEGLAEPHLIGFKLARITLAVTQPGVPLLARAR